MSLPRADRLRAVVDTVAEPSPAVLILVAEGKRRGLLQASLCRRLKAELNGCCISTKQQSDASLTPCRKRNTRKSSGPKHLRNRTCIDNRRKGGEGGVRGESEYSE